MAVQYCRLYAPFATIFRNYWSDSWNGLVDQRGRLLNCNAAMGVVEWVPLGWSSAWSTPYTSALPPSSHARSTLVGFYGNEKFKVNRGALISRFERQAHINVSRKMGRVGFGKGNVSLYAARMLDTKLCLQVQGLSAECYRMYEALDAGCVPIIVDELGAQSTASASAQYRFLLNRSTGIAPFPHAASSAELAASLARFSTDSAELDALQLRTLRWWRSTLQQIRGRILDVSGQVIGAGNGIMRARGDVGAGGDDYSRGQLLLAHIAFYSNRVSEISQIKPIEQLNYHALLTNLNEMETAFDMFSHIDAVVDANAGNPFIELLQHRGRDVTANRKLHVRVDVHANLSHPFLLTWAHRRHMARCLDSYGWFLYLEADVLVPATAMRAQTELAIPLYDKRQLLLTFVRTVNDSKNRFFFSDMRNPAPRSAVVEVSGLGTFVKPTSTYAAAWAYPQKIMKGFARSDADWTWQGGKSIREKAAWGWLSRSADMVVLIATPSGLLTDASLRVHHIGKSGPFYRIVRGHGTLPVESLMQARPDWPLEVNRTWRYRL